jgi:hypothetical protein
LISFSKVALQIAAKVRDGISDIQETKIMKEKKKEIDKLIDDGLLDELNDLYKKQ